MPPPQQLLSSAVSIITLWLNSLAIVALLFLSVAVPLSTPSATNQQRFAKSSSSSSYRQWAHWSVSSWDICPSARSWVTRPGSFCITLWQSEFLSNRTELEVREARAIQFYCEMDRILDRFDCAQEYSVNVQRDQCNLCREAYREWACAMVTDTLEDGRLDCETKLMPCPSCASICHQVMRLCPYLSPDRVQFDQSGESLPQVSQYGGHPAFYCPLENDDPSDPAYTSLCFHRSKYSTDPDYVHNICTNPPIHHHQESDRESSFYQSPYNNKRAAPSSSSRESYEHVKVPLSPLINFGDEATTGDFYDDDTHLNYDDVNWGTRAPHYTTCCWTYASSVVNFENFHYGSDRHFAFDKSSSSSSYDSSSSDSFFSSTHESRKPSSVSDNRVILNCCDSRGACSSRDPFQPAELQHESEPSSVPLLPHKADYFKANASSLHNKSVYKSSRKRSSENIDIDIPADFLDADSEASPRPSSSASRGASNSKTISHSPSPLTQKLFDEEPANPTHIPPGLDYDDHYLDTEPDGDGGSSSTELEDEDVFEPLSFEWEKQQQQSGSSQTADGHPRTIITNSAQMDGPAGESSSFQQSDFLLKSPSGRGAFKEPEKRGGGRRRGPLTKKSFLGGVEQVKGDQGRLSAEEASGSRSVHYARDAFMAIVIGDDHVERGQLKVRPRTVKSEVLRDPTTTKFNQLIHEFFSDNNDNNDFEYSRKSNFHFLNNNNKDSRMDGGVAHEFDHSSRPTLESHERVSSDHQRDMVSSSASSVRPPKSLLFLTQVFHSTTQLFLLSSTTTTTSLMTTRTSSLATLTGKNPRRVSELYDCGQFVLLFFVIVLLSVGCNFLSIQSSELSKGSATTESMPSPVVGEAVSTPWRNYHHDNNQYQRSFLVQHPHLSINCAVLCHLVQFNLGTALLLHNSKSLYDYASKNYLISYLKCWTLLAENHGFLLRFRWSYIISHFTNSTRTSRPVCKRSTLVFLLTPKGSIKLLQITRYSDSSRNTITSSFQQDYINASCCNCGSGCNGTWRGGCYGYDYGQGVTTMVDAPQQFPPLLLIVISRPRRRKLNAWRLHTDVRKAAPLLLPDTLREDDQSSYYYCNDNHDNNYKRRNELMLQLCSLKLFRNRTYVNVLGINLSELCYNYVCCNLLRSVLILRSLEQIFTTTSDNYYCTTKGILYVNQGFSKSLLSCELAAPRNCLSHKGYRICSEIEMISDSSVTNNRTSIIVTIIMITYYSTIQWRKLLSRKNNGNNCTFKGSDESGKFHISWATITNKLIQFSMVQYCNMNSFRCCWKVTMPRCHLHVAPRSTNTTQKPMFLKILLEFGRGPKSWSLCGSGASILWVRGVWSKLTPSFFSFYVPSTVRRKHGRQSVFSAENIHVFLGSVGILSGKVLLLFWWMEKVGLHVRGLWAPPTESFISQCRLLGECGKYGGDFSLSDYRNTNNGNGSQSGRSLGREFLFHKLSTRLGRQEHFQGQSRAQRNGTVIILSTSLKLKSIIAILLEESKSVSLLSLKLMDNNKNFTRLLELFYPYRYHLYARCSSSGSGFSLTRNNTYGSTLTMTAGDDNSSTTPKYFQFSISSLFALALVACSSQNTFECLFNSLYHFTQELQIVTEPKSH